MASIRQAALALALAVGALGFGMSPAVAECLPVGNTKDIRDYIGVAFTATVVDVTPEVDPPMWDAAPFDNKVVLDVDRVYRGQVEERLHWNGWTGDCSPLWPDGLRTGERIFVSAAGLDPLGLRDPGTWLLIWREGDDGWRFHRRALTDVYGPFPREALAADTRYEIRKAVGARNQGWRYPVRRRDSIEPMAALILDFADDAWRVLTD